MAAEYRLTSATEPCAIIRQIDGARIPPDMANRDYNGNEMSPGYIQWKESGGVPDPAPLLLGSPSHDWGATTFEALGGPYYERT